MAFGTGAEYLKALAEADSASSEELEAAAHIYDHGQDTTRSIKGVIIPIGFPPRTRLYHLERDVDDPAWNVWLAMPYNGTSIPSHQRHGTFLRLWDGGAVERVTRDESGIRIMQIKESD